MCFSWRHSRQINDIKQEEYTVKTSVTYWDLKVLNRRVEGYTEKNECLIYLFSSSIGC